MSSKEVAVSVRGLSKAYHIAHNEVKHVTLGETLLHKLRNPFAKPERETFWALKDVNFDIMKGDVVGIIGRNGAGKSTLLKVLSQITEPTSGEINLYGRVGSLLEVGTGFHPELTGRENVYMNGAILGMSRSEIRKQFDAIVEFSGTEKFLDTPVKRYSSGMYVRLAFAVAAHLNPEILIVDEVLAVGDAEFQKKCLGKMKDVSSSGRTVLFVSHNMGAVATLCNRAIMLHKGSVVADGVTEDIISQYQGHHEIQTNDCTDLREVQRNGEGEARFTHISIKPRDHYDTTVPLIYEGCDLEIEIGVEAFRDTPDANLAVIIYDSSGFRLIDISSALKGEFVTYKAGDKSQYCFVARDLLLRPGTYLVGLWLGRHGVGTSDDIEYATSFQVHENPNDPGFVQIFPGPYTCRFDFQALPSIRVGDRS